MVEWSSVQQSLGRLTLLYDLQRIQRELQVQKVQGREAS